MATLDVRYETKDIPGNKWEVTFWDPADPGKRYTVQSDRNLTAARTAGEALIASRKAAGLSYPGKPAASNTVTVTV